MITSEQSSLLSELRSIPIPAPTLEEFLARLKHRIHSMILDAFKKSGRRSEGVLQRQIGIGVLQATGMPSVLVETGYLTNQQEERYLNSSKGQDQVVSNIMTAFRQYMKQTTTPKGNAIRRE